MPISPDMAESLAKQTLEIMLQGETVMLEKVARRIARGIDGDGWAEAKLAEIQTLRRQAETEVARILGEAGESTRDAVGTAYNRGAATAGADLVDMGVNRELAFGRVDLAKIETLVAETNRQIASTGPRILRTVNDGYRDVIARTTADVLTGTTTRREAAQRALDTFARRGITGFQDRAGRNWDLASYSEMAVRTATGRAAVQGHTDRLLGAGQDLVIVSDAPQECELCLVPGTVVEGPVPEWRSRLEYTGDVISITTASGKNLTGTPDHAVLTPGGWRRLKDLDPGDQVISNLREHGVAGVVPDDVQMPSVIEEAGEPGTPVLLAGPTRRDLDQGRTYREVRAVFPDRDLLPERLATIGEPVRQLLLVGGLGALLACDDLALGLVGLMGPTPSVVGGLDHRGTLLGSGVGPSLPHGLTDHRGSLLMRERGHVLDHGMMPEAGLDASATQVVGDRPSADAEGGTELLRSLAGSVSGHEFGNLFGVELAEGLAGRSGGDATGIQRAYESRVADAEGGHDLLAGLAGQVAADEVVDVSVRQYSGHVYDLTTGPGWFLANGIVTHNCRPYEGRVLSISGQTSGTVTGENLRGEGTVTVTVFASLSQARSDGLFHSNCRHAVSLYQPGVTRPMSRRETEDPQGDSDRQELRRLERGVRDWKKREAVAITDGARDVARGRQRDWQARIREHVAGSSAKRQRARERLGAR